MEALRKSLVGQEISKILEGGEKPVHYTWSAELFADNYKVEVIRIDFVNVSGDYGQDWQDYISACFKILPSVYQRLVYPNKDKLEVHLIRIPLTESTARNLSSPQLMQKLKAYLINPVDLMENQNIEFVSDKYLDQMGFMDLPVQLTDGFANAARLYQLGGNYRSAAPSQVLLSCLQQAAQANIKFSEEKDIRVDLIPPDNTSKREVIVIPHGMRLEDVPHYLQDREGGIYNAGIRMFYQRGCFYVWPKYYLGGKSQDRKVLTIFNLPENQFPHIERTYRETDFQVIVLSTGESKRMDTTTSIDLNQGNGIRFTDANALLDGMVQVSGNKAVARRGWANSEFIDELSGRGVDFAPVARQRVSANPFSMSSQIAVRKGVIEQFVWHNANPYLLYPGMEVRVITYRNGKLFERSGSLVGGEYHMGPKANNFMSNQMVITGGLSVFSTKEHVEIG